MRSLQKPMKTVISSAIAAILASNTANAGSFALYTESSPAAIGNFAAGIAAEARDASTGWYNPAGLALIHDQQLVFGAVGVFPSSKITGTSTFTTATPLGTLNYVQSYNGLQGAKDAAVPSFHYALPLGENAAFGLSVVAPFGLMTDWSRTSAVRYAATMSTLTTMNVAPEIGANITEHFALGLGIDLQYARVTFNSMIGSPAVMQALGFSPTYLDTMSYNKGHSFGVGFHAGALAMFNENHTRVGLNYQSQVQHTFHGYSRFNGPLATPGLSTASFASLLGATNSVYWSNSLFSNTIDLPDVVTLSGYQDINERLALLGSVVYTGWHSLRTIQLNNVAAYAPPSGPLPGRQVRVNSVSPEYYDNAWRFALGANYYFTPQWMLRVGGGYDETPTTDLNRSIRVPDSSRWALSVGSHYQMIPSLGVDFGYTHLFSVNDSGINKTIITGATSTYNLNADIKAHADLVGVQVNWLIDDPVPMKA